MKKKKPQRSPEKRRYSEEFILCVVILIFGAFTLLLEFLTEKM
uniref:Uncharacterized protein n=1 Tax=Siphoviridae sp. ctOWj17 TaxID=2826312 RepID=A0A8S5QSK7_9CAUD|nr:MAG TPA: hypothetical protein [Siphoviridae sp. ctOWj17]